MALSPHRSPWLWLAGVLACAPEAPLEAPPPAPAPNGAPVVSSLVFDPAEPLPGETVRVHAEVSDPDEDTVALAFDWAIDGRPAGDGTARLRLPDSEKGQQIHVRVIASDGRLDSEPAMKTVSVGDRSGVLQGLLIQPGHEVTAGEAISVQAQTSDADGDAVSVTFRWRLNGDETDTTGDRFATHRLKRGDRLEVEVRIDDDGGDSLTSPPIHITNAPPQITSRPVPPGADGFHYVVEASDPDGDSPLRFSLENPPRGMTIGALTGEVRWRPTRAQAGLHPIEILVDDGQGGRVSHAFELQVGGSPPASDSLN